MFFVGTSDGGFGNVFGPTVNNASKRESFAGSFTAYAGNHEIKVGGDYSNDATFGTTYYTGGNRVRIRPCLQDGGNNQCDLGAAPFYTNGQGETLQVFYQHDLLANGTSDNYEIIDASPFNTPTKRYSGFIQDQWRIIPTLTMNLGVRYDSESFSGFSPDPAIGEFKAFDLTNQWAPRIGLVWDWAGDGTSKLYASAGRFYFALPTDLNVRVFTANSAAQTYNYDFDSIVQDPAAPRRNNFQGGSASGEPVDGWTEGVKNGTPLTKASYQDELTLGVEKALDPTLSVGLKGTYRTLGRTVEDRCDLDGSVAPSTCALFNPGGDGQAASGEFPTCNGSGNPTDPTAGDCSATGFAPGDAKRIFRGIELVARKQFSNQLWAQASFLYSSLKGNYSGAIREASGQTDPGINADYDYYQFTFNDYGNLELDRPVQARIDAVYNAPFGLSMGARLLRPLGSPGLAVRMVQRLLPGPPVPRHARHERSLVLPGQPDSDGLRPEPLARVQREHRAGDDHPAGLSLQRHQPSDGDQLRRDVQPRWQLRDGHDQPVLWPGRLGSRRGNLPGGGRCAVPGQPGLPEDQPAQQPAASPRGAQGHLLESFLGRFLGAASAAPFFLSPIRKVQGLVCGSKGTRPHPSRTRPRPCVLSLFSVT